MLNTQYNAEYFKISSSSIWDTEEYYDDTKRPNLACPSGLMIVETEDSQTLSLIDIRILSQMIYINSSMFYKKRVKRASIDD